MKTLTQFTSAMALALWSSTLAVRAADVTLAEQFAVLQSQFDENLRKGQRAMREGTPSNARPAVNDIQVTEEFISRFAKLAEEHPQDPASADGLLWLTRRVGNYKGMDQVYAILRRDFPPVGEYADLARRHRDERFALMIPGFPRVGSQTEAKPPKTAEERRAEMAKLQDYAADFLQLAKKYPRDGAAAWSLAWIVSETSNRPEATEATELLLKDHAKSPALERAINSLTHSRSTNAEPLLRTMAEKNPSRAIRGQATLALARVYQERARQAESLQKATTNNSPIERFVGKQLAEQMRRDGPQKMQVEAEKFLALVAEKFADVPYGETTLGEQAGATSFAMGNLVVGKVAPDIEGEDVEGVKFKLSDYRGKVVVIDFWGDW